jgi:hypothetical protein
MTTTKQPGSGPRGGKFGRAMLSTIAVCAAGGSSLAAPPDNWQAIVLHPGGVHSLSLASGAGFQGGRIGNEPVVWQGSPASTGLSYNGFNSAEVRGIGSAGFFGTARMFIGTGGEGPRAVYWSHLSASPVDLTPASGILTSEGNAIAGDQQVGYVTFPYPNDRPTAALWRGTAASHVNLHPVGAQQSYAFATDGMYQGGTVSMQGVGHAALWNGSAASLVSLNPAGSTSAAIRAMVPGTQAGYARMPGNPNSQAAVWHGSAATYINMNPEGAAWSEIHGTTGSIHVGKAWFSSLPDALLWWGDNPNDFINLHSMLPGNFSASGATGVYVNGDTIYVSGHATLGGVRAVLWIGTIPSPSGAIVMLGGLALLGRRQR